MPELPLRHDLKLFYFVSTPTIDREPKNPNPEMGSDFDCLVEPGGIEPVIEFLKILVFNHFLISLAFPLALSKNFVNLSACSFMSFSEIFV